MSYPALHEEITIGFVEPQITTEDSNITLLAPRFVIIDKKEMAILVELKHDRVNIVIYQRTALDDRWHGRYVNGVAWHEYPLIFGTEIPRNLHGIVIVRRLARHWLVFHFYSLRQPSALVYRAVSCQPVVIGYPPEDVVTVFPFVQFFKDSRSLPTGEPAWS